MQKNIFITALIFITLLSAQLYIVPFVSIGYIAPNLLIIFLVYITLKEGQIHGTFTGFIFGFIFDFVSGGVIGSGMFAYTIAGFTAGYFFDENNLREDISFVKLLGIIFFVSLVNNFFYSILGTNEAIDMGILFFDQSLFSAVYTSLLSILLIVFFRK